MDGTTKESGFKSQRGQKGFSLCHCIHTHSGVHPASWPVGTEVEMARKLSRPLISVSAEVKNACSPIHLHGIVCN
jgi:hypothetical protein